MRDPASLANLRVRADEARAALWSRVVGIHDLGVHHAIRAVANGNGGGAPGESIHARRARAERLDVDGLVSAQLQFDGVLPASGDQLTLLGARSPRVDRLAWSTAAIAIRYGADRVVHAEIVDPDDARPERRTRLVRAHPEVGE